MSAEPHHDTFITGTGLPAPFMMNRWKHHLGYVLEAFRRLSERGHTGKELLRKHLASIGSSQTDLYTGPLSPSQIAACLKESLQKSGYFEKAEFLEWIQSRPGRYQNILIEDNSSWTILCSGNTENYIHIHPARFSENSLRIRSCTLKTLLALRWFGEIENLVFSLETINQARQSFFGAPPVKSLNSIQGIRKYFGLFCIQKPPHDRSCGGF